MTVAGLRASMVAAAERWVAVSTGCGVTSRQQLPGARPHAGARRTMAFVIQSSRGVTLGWTEIGGF